MKVIVFFLSILGTFREDKVEQDMLGKGPETSFSTSWPQLSWQIRISSLSFKSAKCSECTPDLPDWTELIKFEMDQMPDA